jgi:hypothetical protein
MKTAACKPIRCQRLMAALAGCLGGMLAAWPGASQAQAGFQVDRISHAAGYVTLEFTDSRLLVDPAMGHALEYSETLGEGSWTFTYLLGTTFSSLGGAKRRVTVQAPNARGFYRIGVDSDRDGLTDPMESGVLGTNPNVADTDADGYSDLIELGSGTLPTTALSRPLRGVQPGVQFATPTSRSIEGAGTVLIPVEFDRLYGGSLQYVVAVMSTATNGVDFTAPQSGTLAANGTTAAIPLVILDDLVVEDIEAIVLELRDDAAGSYHTGAFPTHTVLVMDNDANWSGLLQSDVGETSFRLRLLRSGGQASALLIPSATSDATHLGGQLIPPPPAGQAGWELTEVTWTASEFSGVSVALPAGSSRLLGPVPLLRTLCFAAVAPAPGVGNLFYLFKNNDSFGPVVIGGEFTETLTSSQPATTPLQFTNHGYFFLTREAPVMTPLPIPTTPAQP